ncbi:MAG: Mov34/MPN/PAD-1 family protein [Mariprofundus sp.]
MTTSRFEPERFRSSAYLAVIDDSASSGHMHISASCLAALYQDAEKGYPLEICGLLIGRINHGHWMVSDIRPVANLNTDRAADRFQLDPTGYQRIDRELRGSGEEIIGVYHSHPDCPAKPSPTDLDSAWEGFAYPIISVCDGRARDILCWTVNTENTTFQNIRIVETV